MSDLSAHHPNLSAAIQEGELEDDIPPVPPPKSARESLVYRRNGGDMTVHIVKDGEVDRQRYDYGYDDDDEEEDDDDDYGVYGYGNASVNAKRRGKKVAAVLGIDEDDILSIYAHSPPSSSSLPQTQYIPAPAAVTAIVNSSTSSSPRNISPVPTPTPTPKPSSGSLNAQAQASNAATNASPSSSSLAVPNPPRPPPRSPLRPALGRPSTSSGSSPTPSSLSTASPSPNLSSSSTPSPSPSPNPSSSSTTTTTPANPQSRFLNPPSSSDFAHRAKLTSSVASFASIYNSYTYTYLSSKEGVPPVPAMPLVLPPSIQPSASQSSSSSQTQTNTGASSIQSPPPPPPAPKKPKLHHALIELLSSERSYMMDLDLLRGLYIPLAIGHRPSLGVLGIRSALPSSLPSLQNRATPTPGGLSPTEILEQGLGEASMSPADIRTVFSNVDALWGLSEKFGRRLENALRRVGSVDLTGVIGLGGAASSVVGAGSGTGTGRGSPPGGTASLLGPGVMNGIPGGGETENETVADILLDMIPALEGPYTYYITRHPRALERWTTLCTPPPLPAGSVGSSSGGAGALGSGHHEGEGKKKKDKERDKDKKEERGEERDKDGERIITPATSLNPYTKVSASVGSSAALSGSSSVPSALGMTGVGAGIGAGTTAGAAGGPLTPFRKYIQTTAQLMQACQLTNAWDVPSLLIKPIQRLLKYGLLIGAIIDAAGVTSPSSDPSSAPSLSSSSSSLPQDPATPSPDELNKLKRAKSLVEQIARRVNERKRRLEVVRGALLDSKSAISFGVFGASGFKNGVDGHGHGHHGEESSGALGIWKSVKGGGERGQQASSLPGGGVIHPSAVGEPGLSNAGTSPVTSSLSSALTMAPSMGSSSMGDDFSDRNVFELQTLQKRLKSALGLIESFEQGIMSNLQRTRGGNAALAKWARAFGRVIACNTTSMEEEGSMTGGGGQHGSEALAAFEEICRVSVATPDHTVGLGGVGGGHDGAGEVLHINGSAASGSTSSGASSALASGSASTSTSTLISSSSSSSSGGSAPSLNTHWQSLETHAKHLLLLLHTLKQTATGPTKIFKSLNTLHVSHKTLLNIPYSKSRPPPSLVSASQSYLALASAVKEEVPVFLDLLEKGVGRVIVAWAKAQEEYWKGVRDVWMSLWNALGMMDVSGDGFGAEECIRIWWERFEEIERYLSERQLLTRRAPYPPPLASSSASMYNSPTGSSLARNMSHRSHQSYQSYQSHHSHHSHHSYQSQHSHQSYSSYPSPAISQVPGAQPVTYGYSSPIPHSATSSYEFSLPSHISPSKIERTSSSSRQYSLPPPPPLQMESIHPRRPQHNSYTSGSTSTSSYAHRRSDSQFTANTMTSSTTRSTSMTTDSYRASIGGDTLWDYTVFEEGLKIASGESAVDANLVGIGDAEDFAGFTGQSPTASIPSIDTLGKPPPYTRHLELPNQIARSRSQNHLSARARSQSSPGDGRGRRFSQSSEVERSSPPPVPAPPSDLYAPVSDTASQTTESGTGNGGGTPILPLSEPLYICTTVHPFIPPQDAYAPSAIPFLTLQVGDTVHILQELGSPSQYEGFADVIEDDGRDCLLIARDELGVVGWVLASFLVPLH